MFIQRIISQHRRDLVVNFECEHCGFVKQGSGYDDAHFHNDVVPGLTCDNCSKTAGPDYKPMKPRYPEGVQV
jgi:hypothetical protein